jgi:pimeloyl-ACP methyl ester carboxylesterase
MSTRPHKGWTVHESGPAGAAHAALLLSGGLCTAAFYDDVLADPRLAEAPIRFAATTVPGFGGTTPLDDPRFESYSAAAAELAADLGCDVVVGHSLGANLAIEMLGAGQFKGEVGLTDEERRRLERCTNVELVTVRGSGHLALTDSPGIVAGLILDAVNSAADVAAGLT